jgi:NADP-dependent alcohol dehydrogenase
VKFISGAVNYSGDPMEILQKRILIKENAILLEPYYFTSNRSEMNSGAVVTIQSTQEISF